MLLFLIAAAVVIFVSWRLPSANPETVAEFAQPYAEIQTEALGLSVAAIDSLITVPLTLIEPIYSSVNQPAVIFETAVDEGEEEKSLVTGAILLVHQMPLFDWRVAIINLLGISRSFLAALAVLHLRGSPKYSKVFSGLVTSIGAVCDGAFLMLQAIGILSATVITKVARRRRPVEPRVDSIPLDFIVSLAAVRGGSFGVVSLSAGCWSARYWTSTKQGGLLA